MKLLMMPMMRLSILLFLPTTALADSCPVPFWQDEFDSNDLSKWDFMIGDGCDLGICGWGNNELQYYTNSNAIIQNGILSITTKRDTEYEFTSSRLRTLGTGDFDLKQPTRIEARIKPPSGNNQGLWSAFWLLPSRFPTNYWPRGGEIDIFEHIGRQDKFAQGHLHYGNLYNDKAQKGGPLKLPTSVGDDFRTYAIEKRPSQIDFFVDGYLYQSYTAEDIEAKFTWPFEDHFHLIMNLAVGGHWPGYPNESTVFPASLEIDYVRVYDISETKFPSITGATNVRINETQGYCLLDVGDDYPTISWEAPTDATMGEGFVRNGSPCIWVTFGETSGFVSATTTSGCQATYRVPVHVHPYFGVEFSFVSASGMDDRATYTESTGAYTAVADGNINFSYQRKLEEVYDHIMFSTSAVADPMAYVNGEKLFYLSVKTTTSAPCTRVILQLEDSSVSVPDNFPKGRHSRYIGFLDKDSGGNLQRIKLEFADRIDFETYTVDRITILFDSFMQRSDVYHVAAIDSAVPGCTSGDDCEAFVSDNTCRKRAKSEWGACDDGFNNDGFGYDGDGPVDCDDSDCWEDPVCQAPPPPPAYEICDDGIDNDGDGDVDCRDEDCASSSLCGSWYDQLCTSHSSCAGNGEELCCPHPIMGYMDCCNPSPASCAVHTKCADRKLTGDCCPTSDTSQFLDCCDMSLCSSNPKCSGLDGPACCPTPEGVYLECCEEKPGNCQIHPKCAARGLQGECCPAPPNEENPDGLFLDCCHPRECAAHPACKGLANSCCPNDDGVYLDCCFLDMPGFDGSSLEFTTVESYLARSGATAWGFCLLTTILLLFGLL